MKNRKDVKAYKKIAKAEVEDFLQFKRRHSVVKSKKGKGSYDRKKFKKGG
jgi:stalled ribosome alternative rescue factor ArfA